ncbi:hypothetical protein, partial [Nonomuraea sp. NPDC049141]|uniref:hypothetical protein n=1 Tax=Nonomuraea sp. NPDC049141 TaxID=3155500 RepID=UPI0033C0A9C9
IWSPNGSSPARATASDPNKRESLAAQACAARNGTEADASMDVFNAMAEIRMAASRALSLLHKQQIRFTADRAQAIAELCDGAETAITAVRDLATGSALDDASFMPSTDPARRRVWVTRYMRFGYGDEFSARDAMSAARAAMTSVRDMHRATTFEAANPHPIARKAFATMAQAADECMTKVAGIDKLGPQAVRRENTSLLAQMIA